MIDRATARIAPVGASPTMELAAEAARLIAAGADVVDLGVGAPDFPTPPHVKAAAHEAIQRDLTKYTVNAGLPELRAAICSRYRRDYGVELTERETIVTAGAKQALFNAAMVLFGPGDEVITHAPGWMTLPAQVRLAGAEPVVVRTRAEDGFALHAESVVSAIGPRTRGIVVNSPCNPTGALVDEAELEQIADAAARQGIWVIVDACYERLVHDDVPHNLVRVLFERARHLAVICSSTSKTYAMTGWRCGWAIAPVDVVQACSTLQGHSTSNASTVSQHAALAALTGPEDCVRAMRDEYTRRRDLLWEVFAADGRLHAARPPGAFYLFLDVSDVLSPGRLRTSASLAKALLHEAGVAVFPGEAFDAPGFLRLSYATSESELRRGAQRLLAYLDRLSTASDPLPGGRP